MSALSCLHRNNVFLDTKKWELVPEKMKEAKGIKVF